MPKHWTEEDIGKLRRLRATGATLFRASVALQCHKAAIRGKVRELGIPFPLLWERRSEEGEGGNVPAPR